MAAAWTFKLSKIMTATAALSPRRIERMVNARTIALAVHARGIANPAALDLGGTVTEPDEPGGAMKTLLRQPVPLPSGGDRADARHPR